jgi:hypothetical protein
MLLRTLSLAASLLLAQAPAPGAPPTVGIPTTTPNTTPGNPSAVPSANNPAKPGMPPAPNTTPGNLSTQTPPVVNPPSTTIAPVIPATETPKTSTSGSAKPKSGSMTPTGTTTATPSGMSTGATGK